MTEPARRASRPTVAMVIRGMVFAVCAGALLAQDAAEDVAKELALGEAIAAQTRERSDPLDAAEADTYVHSLARRLEAHLPPPTGITYKFEVRHPRTGTQTDPIVAAGGFVSVPASLFVAAEDEAQFAAVLAHSMAHISARHTRPQKLSEKQHIPMAFVFHSRHSMVPLAYLPRMREFELEADRMALAAVANAGFDPSALADYVRKHHPDPGQRPEFSPWPAKDERLQAIEAAPQATSSSAVVSSGEYAMARDAVLAELERRKRRKPAPSLRAVQRRLP